MFLFVSLRVITLRSSLHNVAPCITSRYCISLRNGAHVSPRDCTNVNNFINPRYCTALHDTERGSQCDCYQTQQTLSILLMFKAAPPYFFFI